MIYACFASGNKGGRKNGCNRKRARTRRANRDIKNPARRVLNNGDTDVKRKVV